MAVRIVLDTNCLVSALIFTHGKVAELRRLWQSGSIIPIVCRETVTELIRVLAYPKFHLSRDEIRILLGQILPWSETVGLPVSCEDILALRDSDDAVFIHLTRAAKAFCLVSGDRHLLELRPVLASVRILSPGEFLDQISAG